jgi:hypothetical protein
VKGHSIALLKVPPDPLRLDAEDAEVCVTDTPLGLFLDTRDQFGGPRRVSAG